ARRRTAGSFEPGGRRTCDAGLAGGFRSTVAFRGGMGRRVGQPVEHGCRRHEAGQVLWREFPEHRRQPCRPAGAAPIEVAVPGGALRNLSIFAIDTSQTYHAGAAGLLGGRAGTGTDRGGAFSPSGTPSTVKETTMDEAGKLTEQFMDAFDADDIEALEMATIW